MKFEIVGDGNAPRFFKINADNGQVAIQRSLREDTDLRYVVRIYFNSSKTPLKLQ